MGLYKRGKVWWMCLMYQGQQVRRSAETTDRRMADAILAKLKVQIVEGRYFDILEEHERTFRELTERYLRERSIGKSLKSQWRDRSMLKHLLAVFGDKTLAEITSKGLAAYRVQRREAGAAPATVNKELGLVRHAFNVAIREWEWCRVNPVSQLKLEPEHNQRDRWLTDEEEGRLLGVSPPWLQEIILFALHTGLRQGEVLALSWSAVDFQRGVLVVMQSKNHERRTIPLNEPVVELLRAKAQRRPHASLLVFTTSQGTPINARNLVRAFTTVRKKAGLEDVRFHDLRHTFATRLVQAGVDLYKVQRLLGHKTPTMTQRYAHHSPESLRDGVRVLEQRARGRVSQIYHIRDNKPEASRGSS